MKAPDKKDLIKGMAELLQAHEEPYEIGSWEDFVHQQRGKRPKSYAWIGYAAVLALMMALSVIIFNRETKIPAITARIIKPKVEKSTDTTVVNGLPAPVYEQEDRTAKVHAQITRSNIPVAKVRNVPVDTIPTIREFNEQLIAANQMEKENEAEPVNAAVATPKPADFNKFLENETERTVVTNIKDPSKWDFGVEVSPTILDSKVSMGAGITTGYRLSQKFSISTGIAYVSLDAEKNVNNQPVSLMSSKKLTSIDANIRAIDIPLALTYHLNKKLYTSVGVSYFNVLSEQRSKSYLTELEVSRTMANPATGKIETFQATLAEANVEPAEENPLTGNGYLGFFNFSIGHVQPLYKNHKIVLEPFIKIPLGKLSDDDLKLSNGGIKFRYSF